MADHQRVRGGGGVELAARVSGPADGRPVVLLHGFGQGGLSWRRQWDAPTLAGCRLVCLDLRGHGASDRPRDEAAYQDGRLWAEDVAAVIRDLGLERPVLVGWSYGGFVIGDYLRAFGDDALGGVVYAGGALRIGSDEANALLGPDLLETLPGMIDPDLARNVAATRRFVHACAAAPIDPEDLETALIQTAMVPLAARRGLLFRQDSYDDAVAGLRVPTLIVHGTDDRLVLFETAEIMARLQPSATLERYAGIGHMPFAEAADRFNADLGAFVAALE